MQAERTPHADDSLLQTPLLAVTEFGLRAPATVLVVATALALACLAVTLNGLTFKTSRLDLLNPRSEYNQRWLAYLAEFGSRDEPGVVRADRTFIWRQRSMIWRELCQEPRFFESVFLPRDLSRLASAALFAAEELAAPAMSGRRAAPAGEPASDCSCETEREAAHVAAAARAAVPLQQYVGRGIGGVGAVRSALRHREARRRR
jgi:hypothetical protein